MPLARTVTLLLALAGCPKPAAPASSAEELAAIPRLPAPRAGTYARVPDRPADPVIAAIVEKHTWDASLSGAAAGLALDLSEGRSGLYGWEVREAAWDAGYPYPIAQVRGWNTAQGAAPPPDLLTWLDTLDKTVDLGLVRARGGRGDAWVALVAKPRVDIGVQPRQTELGAKLKLPAVPGTKYTVVDPAGGVYDGSLDMAQEFTADLGGEWLFQVADATGVAAKYPVYVSMIPPELALLTARDAPRDDAALLDRARDVLVEVHEAYGNTTWEEDALLQAAARSALDGQAPQTAALATKLGFSPERFWKLECQAATVEDCIDRIVWNPYQRPALVSDSRYWGLAARRAQPGVRIVAFVAME